MVFFMILAEDLAKVKNRDIVRYGLNYLSEKYLCNLMCILGDNYDF